MTMTIGAEGGNRPAGVDERLALLDARRGRGDQRGGCAERFGREFERGSGACRSLVEEQDHALTAQQLRRFARIHALRQLEIGIDLCGSKLVGTK